MDMVSACLLNVESICFDSDVENCPVGQACMLDYGQ